MKIRYVKKGLKPQTAHITAAGIVLRGKYGTHVTMFKKQFITGDVRESLEHQLAREGFIKQKLWECTTPSCTRVQSHNPCLLASLKDPSGECLIYPRDEFPDVPHDLVVFKSV